MTRNWFCLTFVAKCSIIGRVGTVTGITMIFLYAFASILTVSPITGAVA